MASFASRASPAFAQSLATGPSPEVPWLRLGLSLLLCFSLAFGAALLLRRHRLHGSMGALASLLRNVPGTSRRRIAIIETQRASAHGDLCLVELDGQPYLLAFTPGGASLIDRPSAPSFDKDAEDAA